MTFRMKTVSWPVEQGDWGALEFAARWQGEDGAVVRRLDPVRDPEVGAYVEYGPLFAYLFRRFGAPNAFAAGERLARYVLATPARDMFLLIEPTLEGRANDVFTFVAPTAVCVAANNYGEQVSSELSAAHAPGWVRPMRLADWNDGDPLKRYGLGAVHALRALRRPVLVERHGAIDVFGAVPVTQRALRAREG